MSLLHCVWCNSHGVLCAGCLGLSEWCGCAVQVSVVAGCLGLSEWCGCAVQVSAVAGCSGLSEWCGCAVQVSASLCGRWHKACSLYPVVLWTWCSVGPFFLSAVSDRHSAVCPVHLAFSLTFLFVCHWPPVCSVTLCWPWILHDLVCCLDFQCAQCHHVGLVLSWNLFLVCCQWPPVCCYCIDLVFPRDLSPCLSVTSRVCCVIALTLCSPGTCLLVCQWPPECAVIAMTLCSPGTCLLVCHWPPECAVSLCWPCVPQDLSPYLPSVIPGLKQCLLDPVPEVRSVSARALGAMVKGMGEGTFDDLLPWLMEKLVSEVSSVDRSGAAQGERSWWNDPWIGTGMDMTWDRWNHEPWIGTGMDMTWDRWNDEPWIGTGMDMTWGQWNDEPWICTGMDMTWGQWNDEPWIGTGMDMTWGQWNDEPWIGTGMDMTWDRWNYEPWIGTGMEMTWGQWNDAFIEEGLGE